MQSVVAYLMTERDLDEVDRRATNAIWGRKAVLNIIPIFGEQVLSLTVRSFASCQTQPVRPSRKQWI